MFKKFKRWMDQRRINSSRGKAAEVLIQVGKGKGEIVDTEEIFSVGTTLDGVSVTCTVVSCSFARIDGLVWPSRSNVALPLEANAQLSETSFGDMVRVTRN